MDIETLLRKTYSEDRPGLTAINPPQPENPDVSILYAHLGEIPGVPFFGDIIAVVRCKTVSGNRYFELRFHIWKPKQAAVMANKITDVREIAIAAAGRSEYLVRNNSNFGIKATWLYTPNSELDLDSRMLRSAAAALKRYSVDNELRQKFRSRYKI